MEKLTVYVTRYITSQQEYLMFMECLECIYKHIKDFDFSVIIFTDTVDSEYDRVIYETYKNITFITPDQSINPEWYAMMYHYQRHPTEYMVYIMDNTMLTRDIHANTVINAINTYGCYNFCYNECISEWFTIRYDLIKYFVPELIEQGSYKDYMDNIITPQKISAQGNQMFTSYTAIVNMFNKFPSLVQYILTAKSIKYDDLKQHVNLPEYSDIGSYIRDIRSLCDYVTSQCFFYTYTFPTTVKLMDETPDCMYGCVITNWLYIKDNILGRYEEDPTSWCIQPTYWNKYLHHKDDPKLSQCFMKFTTKRVKVE